MILKFIRKWKELWIAKITLKKNKGGRMHELGLKTYYKATVIVAVHIKRWMEQHWESKHTFTNLWFINFYKITKTTGQETVFSINGARALDTMCPAPQKKERTLLHGYLPLCTKSTSIWITDLNLRARITKLSEENIGQNLCDL